MPLKADAKRKRLANAYKRAVQTAREAGITDPSQLHEAGQIAEGQAQITINNYEDPPPKKHQILNITAGTLRERERQVRAYIRKNSGYTVELLAVGVQHVRDGCMPKEAYQKSICGAPILGAATTGV